jgi:tetratricopeptide (TPR) repeat protein
MKKLYNTALFFVLLLSAVSAAFAQEQSEREKGFEFYEKGEYQKAVETLQKVVENNKKDRKAWLYLGMSQLKSPGKSKPAKAFKAADKISGEDTEADANRTKVKIISKPRATYTDAARQNQTQGVVKLAVEFGADGKIKEVFPFQTLPDGLTQICFAAAKAIKFDPATKDGKPYTTIGIVSYSFTIY